MSLHDLFQAMYDSRLGTALAESLYVYPLVEGIHLLSLAFSFGLLVLVDLRLLGIALPSTPVGTVLRQLRPWMIGGFAATFVTGILLMFALGPKLLTTFVFPLKLLIILLAALNALWFEWKLGRDQDYLSGRKNPSVQAKIAGAISLTSWSFVVVLGRLIPYFDGSL
jgi:hypothetical protein